MGEGARESLFSGKEGPKDKQSRCRKERRGEAGTLGAVEARATKTDCKGRKDQARVPPAFFPRLADPPVSSALPHSCPALPIGAATPLTHSGQSLLPAAAFSMIAYFFLLTRKKSFSRAIPNIVFYSPSLPSLVHHTTHISGSDAIRSLRFLLSVHYLVLGFLDSKSL